MSNPVVRYCLNEDAFEPTKKYSTDACYDLYIPRNFRRHYERVSSNQLILDTGVSFDIPEGYYIRIAGRSSSFKNGLIVTEGIVDEGYTGSVKIMVSADPSVILDIKEGQRIAQFMLVKSCNETLTKVESIKPKPRGDKGFGSTGK